MRIPQIVSSHWNHGADPRIICTVTTEHEVAFAPEEIVRVLLAAASDDMAKVINTIGAIFNMDQFAEAHASDCLNQQGREFIEAMAYFISGKEDVE